MSKAVLISIQPKWCELIASVKKTVEVRKTKPKIETPFKCYIYATWNGNSREILAKEGKAIFTADYRTMAKRASGKVIGEFVCDNILEYTLDPYGHHSYFISDDDFENTCLTFFEELWNYGKGKTLYGWHISELVIYDEPIELGEFVKPCNHDNCLTCDRYDYIGHRCYGKITRPPQSWCYVEERSRR